jgi:hypothetical protein
MVDERDQRQSEDTIRVGQADSKRRERKHFRKQISKKLRNQSYSSMTLVQKWKLTGILELIGGRVSP